MPYIDPYDGNKAGVLAKFSFKMVTDEDYDETNPEVGFDGDLEYGYSVERLSDDADVDALKAHSSFVGTKLLLDVR